MKLAIRLTRVRRSYGFVLLLNFKSVRARLNKSITSEEGDANIVQMISNLRDPLACRSQCLRLIQKKKCSETLGF
jgi:hypothetical protein